MSADDSALRECDESRSTRYSERHSAQIDARLLITVHVGLANFRRPDQPPETPQQYWLKLTDAFAGAVDTRGRRHSLNIAEIKDLVRSRYGAFAEAGGRRMPAARPWSSPPPAIPPTWASTEPKSWRWYPRGL